MSNLLAHEGKECANPAKRMVEEEPEYSSSSDENSAGGFIDEGVEYESSEEEEFTVRVSIVNVRVVLYSPQAGLYGVRGQRPRAVCTYLWLRTSTLYAPYSTAQFGVY